MEKSLFIQCLGDYPLIRVLDFLLENRIYDYTKKDISENADVAWSTLHTFWQDIEQLGIVIKTRSIGRAELFKLNIESPIVKSLIALDKSLTIHAAPREEAIMTLTE